MPEPSVTSSVSEPLPSSQLFTVRVWPEDLGEGRSEWRGSVELLGTGKKCYFRGLPQVSEIIAAALGEISILKNFMEEKNK